MDNRSGSDLLAWLASLPPSGRDAAIEEHFGIAPSVPPATPPGEHLIGYHPSGVAAIVHALMAVPVSADDVFVDLGSGLGKVVLLAALLTGATARGIELQPALVERARESATRLGVNARFHVGDVREADLDDGTVFFLYAPFTGPVLAAAMDRLRAVAERRAIVVCALGIDLDRSAPWLVRRAIHSFWLAIYDSRVPGVGPRRVTGCPAFSRQADAIASERALLAGRSSPEPGENG
ncbi:MAG TPA: class I SAM-dependent methyltransferase [Polyangiaceae bacterium]|nr:class I SAM-dependent methyltransferase [Polyangiaceae bacterium]